MRRRTSEVDVVNWILHLPRLRAAWQTAGIDIDIDIDTYGCRKHRHTYAYFSAPEQRHIICAHMIQYVKYDVH